MVGHVSAVLGLAGLRDALRHWPPCGGVTPGGGAGLRPWAQAVPFRRHAQAWESQQMLLSHEALREATKGLIRPFKAL